MFTLAQYFSIVIRTFIYILIGLFVLVSCQTDKSNFDIVVPAPGSEIRVHFNLYEGEPYYLIDYNQEIVVGWSMLGFKSENISLCDQMIISDYETGSIRLNELIPGISDNLANYLKIVFGKNDNSQVGFDMFFAATDGAIVFWYEFNTNMLTENPLWKEYSEFDLYHNTQKWQSVGNDLSVDTLYYPAAFVSDKGVKIVLGEMKDGLQQQGYLFKRSSELPEYVIISGKDSEVQEMNMDTNITKSSIKIIRINKNSVNE